MADDFLTDKDKALFRHAMRDVQPMNKKGQASPAKTQSVITYRPNGLNSYKRVKSRLRPSWIYMG